MVSLISAAQRLVDNIERLQAQRNAKEKGKPLQGVESSTFPKELYEVLMFSFGDAYLRLLSADYCQTGADRSSSGSLNLSTTSMPGSLIKDDSGRSAVSKKRKNKDDGSKRSKK
jgi:hypothetical protein